MTAGDARSGSSSAGGRGRSSRSTLTSASRPDDGASPFEFDGTTYSPAQAATGRRHREGMARLALAGRLMPCGQHASIRAVLRRLPGVPHNELLGRHRHSGIRRSDRSTSFRPTRKVVERCMLMCTDPGDLVLDPTCGSGTTAFVAEQWGRRWITIDTSRVALALARQRLMGAKYPVVPARRLGRGPREGAVAHGAGRCRGRQFGDDIRHGFVYERVQHITLKSIANNPDIKEGMTRERDRRGDQAARRLRAALRQALRGHEEGPRRRPVHGRVAEPAPLALLRRQPGVARPRPRPRRTPTRRTSSSRSSTTSRRPASRTAAGRSGSRSRRSRPTRASTSRRSAQRDGEADGDAPSRIAHRDRPAVRHRQPVVREEGGARGDRRRGRRPALRSSASPSTRRSPASPRTTASASRPPTRASPASRASASSAASRC